MVHACSMSNSAPDCSFHSGLLLTLPCSFAFVSALPGSCMVFLVSLLLYDFGLTCVQLEVWGNKQGPEDRAPFLVKTKDMTFSWTFWTLSLEHSKC